jgi:hypothetical protein
MKAPLKKKPSTNSSPKKPKRTSKKTPKKTPVATPKKSYSKIEEIWAAAPDDDTRDNWIYDKLGIPPGNRKGRENCLNHIDHSFPLFLQSLEHLILLGYFFDAAIISAAAPKHLIALLDKKEQSIPEFGKKKTVEKLLKYFANEWSKRRAVPDRKAAQQKKDYRLSCEKALMEVIILHRAGWRRHWNSPTDLPSHPFGSTEGAKDWHAWSINFLQAMHKKGLIRANPDSKAAKGKEVRGRLNVHKSVFNKLYSLSQAHLELKLDFRLARLNAEVEQEGGEVKTFLQAATLEHRDYAPKSRLNELMKHLGLPLLG